MFRKFLNYANDPWMVTGREPVVIHHPDGTVVERPCRTWTFSIFGRTLMIMSIKR
jgi:hypothetical protein